MIQSQVYWKLLQKSFQVDTNKKQVSGILEMI